MEYLKILEDLLSLVKSDTTPTIAVAAGQDIDTLTAIARAVKEDVCKAILVGDKEQIVANSGEKGIDVTQFEIIHEPDTELATVKAVALVKDNTANMLMKGLINTSVFMKTILAKDRGLLPKGGMLSHVAVMEIPVYPKLLLISDAAILPNPDLDQKVKILEATVEVAHAIGIEMPKAALVSANETISFKVQSSVDAAVITAMAQRKQIEGVIVDGPLALDVSLSEKHCRIKGLESPINGEADILIFPNIETANTFYKSTTLLARGRVASMVTGTSAPVVLTSRADEDDSKFYSIVLAARMATKRFFKK